MIEVVSTSRSGPSALGQVSVRIRGSLEGYGTGWSSSRVHDVGVPSERVRETYNKVEGNQYHLWSENVVGLPKDKVGLPKSRIYKTREKDIVRSDRVIPSKVFEGWEESPLGVLRAKDRYQVVKLFIDISWKLMLQDTMLP